MSDTAFPAPAGFGAEVRPLAVRMTEELRAQLDILAQLNGRSTTEECRVALEHWVERSKSNPQVAARAAEVTSEIEREAQAKRDAISSILGAGSTGKSARSPRKDAAE